MPKFSRGDMWDVYDTVDLFCITTNATIRTNERLVMGSGIALQARERFPDIDLRLAQLIGKDRLIPTSNPEVTGIESYNLVFDTKTKIAAFQTKWYFKENAPLSLVEMSIRELRTWVLDQGRWVNVALNFPGIGYGGLSKALVVESLKELPKSVTIWEYENGTVR